jgi:hypothetical protein
LCAALQHPNIGILTNLDTHQTYILPDSVYTGGNINSVEFSSVFGNRRSKTYKNCREYFYFHRTFEGSINDAKQIQKRAGINRYAVFVEGKIYIENSNKFALNDIEIETLYPEPCIIICYNNQHNQLNPDLLVKTYESFVCISYHDFN